MADVIKAKARLVVMNLSDSTTHPQTKMMSELVVLECAKRAGITPQQALTFIMALADMETD